MPASRSTPRRLTAALALASLSTLPTAASAFSPYLVVPDPAIAEASPAYRYANMTDAEAIAEVDRRGILYTRLASVPGVRAPIRLTGRLHGVNVHSSLPPDQRVTSPFEILDARLALALDDFCALLERHDIDEITHFTMYRPNVAGPSHGPTDELARAPSKPAATPARPAGARPRPEAQPIKAKPQAALPIVPSLGKGALDHGNKGSAQGPSASKQKTGDAPKPDLPQKKPAAKTAVTPSTPAKAPTPTKAAAPSAPAKAAAPSAPAKPVSVKKVAKRDAGGSGLHQTTWASPGTRHPAGLAIDVGLLHKRDGRWINIARDFHGKIGAKTCGDGAPMPENADAKELRAIVCESAELGLFTYVLTPDYNAAHADHLHMEIKPGVKWFLTH